MRTHLVQLDIVWEDRAANHARVRQLLSGRCSPGDLVVLPEMFDTGFSFALDRTADDDETTLNFLRTLGKEFHAHVQGSRTVRNPASPKRAFNRATVIGPDGAILTEYDKIHPFTYGRESEFFDGGSAVRTYTWMHDQAQTVVCPAICYDLRFPELFRLGLLAGAEVFAVGANWPAPRATHRRALLIARAIENQAFVIGVNRAGSDPFLTYSGGSMVVGPRGEILAEEADGEQIITVDLNMQELRDWRSAFPAWRDARLLRRP